MVTLVTSANVEQRMNEQAQNDDDESSHRRISRGHQCVDRPLMTRFAEPSVPSARNRSRNYNERTPGGLNSSAPAASALPASSGPARHV